MKEFVASARWGAAEEFSSRWVHSSMYEPYYNLLLCEEGRDAPEDVPLGQVA